MRERLEAQLERTRGLAVEQQRRGYSRAAWEERRAAWKERRAAWEERRAAWKERRAAWARYVR